jgi:hypothetical protein
MDSMSKTVKLSDGATIAIPKHLHDFFNFNSRYESEFDSTVVSCIIRFLDMASKNLDAYCIPFEKRADMTRDACGFFWTLSKKILLESILAANELRCNFYSSYASAYFSMEFVDSLITPVK